ATINLSDECVPADDYFDTALSLDLATGAIKWSRRLEGYDAWTVACKIVPPGRSCPSPHGPDYDLGGSGANLLDNGNLVGFGQKSGIYWALNPEDGSIVWSTFVGPAGSGTLGGIEWGTATDGRRIYTEIADSGAVPYTLVPSGQQISWGSWSALDARSGKILWQTADPTPGSIDSGAVSAANGVVYAGSYDAAGHMYALDAATGKIMWSFASGGSVIGGPSIVGRFVYWGSGYHQIPPGTPNNKVYAFTIPVGKNHHAEVRGR
ncbi:MAG: PQQ-binding-like beta-propeller repeat protein, partial [Terriglobia bacterium]